MYLDNFNVFKALIIEKFLIPKIKSKRKGSILEDDEIDLLIEFWQGIWNVSKINYEYINT